MSEGNDEERKKLLSFSIRELFKIQDEEYLVIKAHLIAEKFLNDILENILPNPVALQSARLTFRQLLALVEAHRPPSNAEQWVWGAFNNLNKLRNEIAHNISEENLKKKKEIFIKSTEPWLSPPEHASGLIRFKFLLFLLCGQLANIRHGIRTAGPST